MFQVNYILLNEKLIIMNARSKSNPKETDTNLNISSTVQLENHFENKTHYTDDDNTRCKLDNDHEECITICNNGNKEYFSSPLNATLISLDVDSKVSYKLFLIII